MQLRRMLLVCGAAAVAAAAQTADAFDGARPIFGTVDRLIEINRQRIIENVDPDAVGFPRSFIIDLPQGTMRGASDSLVRRKVAIQRVEHMEDKLILLGADAGTPGTGSGMGWSLVIEKTTGDAVLSAAGGGIAFVAFGKCGLAP